MNHSIYALFVPQYRFRFKDLIILFFLLKDIFILKFLKTHQKYFRLLFISSFHLRLKISPQALISKSRRNTAKLNSQICCRISFFLPKKVTLLRKQEIKINLEKHIAWGLQNAMPREE